MNRIAVIFRGHLRTWHYIKPAVFEFWESMAQHVDYYFVTWAVPDLDTEKILKDFKNKNLVKFLPVEIPSTPGSNLYGSWKGPGWLSYNIVPYKRLRELSVSYDCVFDTRPDILYRLNGNPIITPEPMTLFTSEINSNGKYKNYYIGLADVFYAMPSNVYDIISTRYIHESSSLGSHYDILQICQRERINACKINWVEAVITRPTSIAQYPDPTLFLKDRHAIDFYLGIQQWASLSSQEKIELCSQHQISIHDWNRSDSPIAKI